MAPNCSVLMCISRLLGPITWGNFEHCSTLFAIGRPPRCARALLHCTASPSLFATTSLWGYRICSKLGLVFSGLDISVTHYHCSPSIRVSCQLLFRHTYSKGDIYYPNYAWTAFPRLVCAEGYIVPGRLNSEVQKSPYTLVQLKVALGFICDRLNLEAFPLYGDDYYSEFTTSPFT